jgi:hypothetical protein
MIPTRVIGGRYVVLAELGRGGMGVVWRAEDRVMGRHVAVKELHLPAGLAPDERLLFRERLLREARTAGRLNAPGIVTVYDVVTDGGVDHIVMELIDARTLADIVAQHGPLDEARAADVARQLLAALQVAHAGGVVHRDVKPANVMLTAAGRVKLTDFGIAQAADDPRLTSTGALIGSPGYMSPERLEGGPATPAADLWALGATLHLAVRGTAPFQRDTTPATISAVLHDDPPPVRTRGPLGAVVGGLLQRDPAARLTGPQAAALLAVPGAAPAADPPTAPVGERLVAPGRRRPGRAVLLALALGLVAGLAGGAAAGFALARADDPDVRTLSYGDGGEVPVYEVAFEYCLGTTPAPDTQVVSSATVPCEDPHPAEVFGVVDTFASDEAVLYPEGLAEFAARACALRFSSNAVVGDKSELAVLALYPTEAVFGRDEGSLDAPNFTQREVYCVLTRADGGQLQGSRLAETG